MSVGEPGSSSTPARPPRVVRLKYAAWVAGILVIVALGVWVWKTIESGAVSRECARQSARNIAASIAIFANQQVIARNYRDLQDYSDNLVRNKPIAFIAIVDSRNRVVVHTNREFLGRKSDGLAASSGVLEASVPVMDLTRQAGTVRVGVRLK